MQHNNYGPISSTQNVNQKIKCIRNHFVLIDSDLAQLFQVETKVLNQAAQRNINRFPDEFRFQLNLIEHSDLKSQNELTKLLGKIQLFLFL